MRYNHCRNTHQFIYQCYEIRKIYYQEQETFSCIIYRYSYSNTNYYFNKDGLYFFYVFDEAGNFFTRVVLIDSSLSASLQGYWEGIEENSKWVNTFDPVKNPANYVNKDTTIYFGSHKALKMPQKPAADDIISFEDTSFTRAYDLSNKSDAFDTYVGTSLTSPTTLSIN